MAYKNNSTKIRAGVAKLKATLQSIEARTIGVSTGITMLKNQVSVLAVPIAESGSMNQMNLLGEFASELEIVHQKLVDNLEDENIRHKKGQHEVSDLRRALEKLNKSGLFRTCGI